MRREQLSVDTSWTTQAQGNGALAQTHIEYLNVFSARGYKERAAEEEPQSDPGSQPALEANVKKRGRGNPIKIREVSLLPVEGRHQRRGENRNRRGAGCAPKFPVDGPIPAFPFQFMVIAYGRCSRRWQFANCFKSAVYL